jgi:3,5-epimerase/4-reductase
MKFLVYGSGGWIGSMVIENLKTNKVDFIEGQSRVDDTERVKSELTETSPSHVICLIGRTHGDGCSTIDYLEQPGKLVDNVKDNLFSPVSLAMLCKERNIHLTYLGTGCIFSQDIEKIESSNGYTEESKPDFFGSGYSTVKGFTDRLMHMFDNVLNVRIRMPIVGFDHPRNFVTKIKSYKKIIDVPNSMTVLPELIPIMLDLSQKKHVGTINLTNPGTISHNEMLDLFKKHVDPALCYENFSLEEQDKVLVSKRSNNKLDTKNLTALYPEIDNIKTSVEKLFKRWCA